MTKKSKIYEQFNTKTRLSMDNGTFNQITEPINIQQSNEEELMRTLLIGLATNQLSSSGPMPGTVDVINFLSSSSGSAVGATESGFYKEPGSVWKIFGPSLSVGGGSGSIQHELRLINDGSTLEILDFSTTGGSLRPTTEDGFIGGEIYVSYPAYLVYEATGTFTSSGLSLGIVRVR
jgi:hypothetical protein